MSNDSILKSFMDFIEQANQDSYRLIFRDEDITIEYNDNLIFDCTKDGQLTVTNNDEIIKECDITDFISVSVF